MAAEMLRAFLVGLQNGVVCTWIIQLHPRQQRGTVVETDLRIVVDDVLDDALSIEDAGRRVGRVAFSRNALVPIVIGMGRILDFNYFKPRILPRRLVEMPVYANMFLQGSIGSSQTSPLPFQLTFIRVDRTRLLHVQVSRWKCLAVVKLMKSNYLSHDILPGLS